MKLTLSIIVLLLGVASLAVYGSSEPAEHDDASNDKETILFSYQGNYKITPVPTLHSDLAQIAVESVELLESPQHAPMTKITYRPHYGKINADSAAFRTKHETQKVSLLINGDHTASVKKGDILRSCYYPN